MPRRVFPHVEISSVGYGEEERDSDGDRSKGTLPSHMDLQPRKKGYNGPLFCLDPFESSGEESEVGCDEVKPEAAEHERAPHRSGGHVSYDLYYKMQDERDQLNERGLGPLDVDASTLLDPST